MNIVFATREEAAEISKKYTVLELDTFKFQEVPEAVVSWCVLDTSSVTLKDLPQSTQFVDLHNNMMRNYRLKNWKYCEDALEHLIGKWRGEVDTFYGVMQNRISSLKENDPGPDWDGSVLKTIQQPD